MRMRLDFSLRYFAYSGLNFVLSESSNDSNEEESFRRTMQSCEKLHRYTLAVSTGTELHFKVCRPQLACLMLKFTTVQLEES